MELYSQSQLVDMRPTVNALDTLIAYRADGVGAMMYSDGTLIVSSEMAETNPLKMAMILNALKSENHNILKVGKTDDENISNEIKRARLLLTEIKNTDKDESEAQATAVEIITYAVNYGCSDVHIFLRNPNVEIRFNKFGSATPPVFSSFDYQKLLKMVARLFNWSGANNASGEFSLKSIQDTTLTMNIEVNKKILPTRLRIEKKPLEQLGDAKIVIRVSPAVQSKSLDDMNMDKKTKDMLSQHMQKPSGMIIVSGPTGSGKTTLLHACLHEFPKDSFCSTIEDPVEVLASFNPLISQHNLNKKVGYKAQIKSLLRMDPNGIVIGEMRDAESAQESVGASLTGHLVLTTLHTNDSLGITSRLNDLGVSYKVQSMPGILSLLVAVRLGKLVCQHCSQPLTKSHHLYDLLKDNKHADLKKIRVKNKKGCSECSSGVSGRKPVIEYINVDDTFREFLVKEDLEGAEKYLISMGWRSLKDLAWIEINKGLMDPYDAEASFKDIVFPKEVNYHYSYED